MPGFYLIMLLFTIERFQTRSRADFLRAYNTRNDTVLPSYVRIRRGTYRVSSSRKRTKTIGSVTDAAGLDERPVAATNVSAESITIKHVRNNYLRRHYDTISRTRVRSLREPFSRETICFGDDE